MDVRPDMPSAHIEGILPLPKHQRTLTLFALHQFLVLGELIPSTFVTGYRCIVIRKPCVSEHTWYAVVLSTTIFFHQLFGMWPGAGEDCHHQYLRNTAPSHGE